MSIHDIQELVEAYAAAAMRAKKAGFDGVQILTAHGFFLSQLLCPRYNDRADAYGGDLTNRARALLEILRAIRNVVGRDYPVLAKLNCRDFVENGLTLDDSVQVGVMLEKGGIDAIELSGGLLNNPNIMGGEIESEAGKAYFQDEARIFKKKIRVPLILVGGIRSYNMAKRLFDEGVADYISMSRPFIREPGLIDRWKAGDLRDSSCISCNNCFEPIKKGEGVSCEPLKPGATETFFPQLSEIVSASPPHPPGAGYKISIGLEKWELSYVPVIKIQMVYDGKTSKLSPSFPLDSTDYQRVAEKVAELLEKQRNISNTA